MTACSTPRGITGKIARGRSKNVATRVLNASRHHRKNRTCGTRMKMNRFECSTPRGITGKIAHEGGTKRDRAQRLRHQGKSLYVTSAAIVLNASRHHRKNRHQRSRFEPPATVLNASRHHRKNRVFDTERSGLAGAQRLAASQEKSPCSETLGTGSNNCAQRLAASQEKSRAPAATESVAAWVLNASRHHRKNRSRCDCRATGPPWRAQRLAASQEKSH